MPVKRLPESPDLSQLKQQAKDLLKGHAERRLDAAHRIREFHPRFRRATDAVVLDGRLKLSDAQLAIAREYGFPSWVRLKAHIERPSMADRLDIPHHERIEDPVFRRAVALLDAGDADGLRAHLELHPKLARQRVVFEGGNYFRNPTLLEFIAENPVRHGVLPANIVALAQVIVEFGVEQATLNATLELVSTGRVTRECKVQLPLIDLLCNWGADPGMALHGAALHGEFEAVQALLARGARFDLPLAAALGQVDEFRRLLAAASAGERHLALALASQFGHVEIVKLLLDAGENPDRYNPVGGHSHSTPLHQAVWAGHEELVRLLAERGARLDIRDVLWQGTPADWAEYGGRIELATYLRSLHPR